MSSVKRLEPRKCIFCGGRPMSREHLWPKWAAPLLQGFAHTQHHDIRVSRAQLRAPHRMRQGSVTHTKFKVVCRSCNNGWMSRLEETVRPALEPMIKGASIELQDEALANLSYWITLKAMVADAEVPIDSVFGDADREAFKRDRQIPDSVRIWLFECGDDRWQSGFRRQSATLSHSRISASITRKPNISGTAFGLGKVLAYVFVSAGDGFTVDMNFDPSVAHKIVPLGSAPIAWPPLLPISAIAADDISETMARIRRVPGYRWHTV